MIDSATGMRAGERYTVEGHDNAHRFTGFFLDGKYYLSPELLTAVGWLEGQQFIYDELDATGAPVYTDRIAGFIEDLTLTLVEGAALKLQEQRFISHDTPSDSEPSAEHDKHPDPDPAATKASPAALWGAVGAAFIVGVTLARLLTQRYRRR